MSALTRDEAQTRARLVSVRHYWLDLDLTGGPETFRSSTVIRFAVREPAADTFVQLRPDTLHEATLNDRSLDPALLADGRLPLTGLARGEHELRVTADMPYSRVGEGMHRFIDPADGLTYVYTQCFMDDAPLVFACFDQPDLKATFDVAVTAPTDWTVLGNGVARHTGESEGRWECATTPPISTYLVAVVAGPYHSLRTEHAGIPFGLHVRHSLAEELDADAGELLDLTRRCFDRYHEIFTEPYPFDSYDQAFVPEFNAGAMENPGLVTFRDTYVFRGAVTETERQTRSTTIAHEMAHMWFGDLVTLRWWDDTWLNESFAEYMGYKTVYETTDHPDVWTDFAVSRKNWGYDADQRSSTHPVAPAPEAVPDTASALLNFDGISYAKGASALRQLVVWLGEKSFLAGINEHFARHRFGNASLAEFLDSLARAAPERDVHAWAGRWLRTSGVDTLVPQTGGGTGQWFTRLRHDGNRPHRLALGVYDRAPADPRRLVLRERPEVDLNADGSGINRVAEGPRPDLLLVNDGDLTYVKARLDETSWGTVREALSGLSDPLARAVAWNAARHMVRDGELPPSAYLETMRAHLPAERDDAIASGVLSFARTQLTELYLTARSRGEALDLLTDTCRELLSRTADGSAPGVRLTAVRTYIDSATDPTELVGWNTAGSAPGGPELDSQLRWRLLLRLAVLGVVGEREIARALAADPGASGQEGAARCRAALPDPVAKEKAWESLFGESAQLSNYLFRATLQGFWHPEQSELLAPYVERYFDAAVRTSARRGATIAQATGRWGFPSALADAETLRRGEECLRTARPSPALRRQLVDQLDDVRRALRVRAVD